jgi:hypothetical protein
MFSSFQRKSCELGMHFTITLTVIYNYNLITGRKGKTISVVKQSNPAADLIFKEQIATSATSSSQFVIGGTKSIIAWGKNAQHNC